MALSDYERRVLHEIELELGHVRQPSRWTRVWAAPLVQALLASIVVAGCVCAATFAPAPVAVFCVGVAAFGLGILGGRAMGAGRQPPVTRRWRPRPRG